MPYETNMFEIIAQTPEDAIAAEQGGATQLDLKANFIEGGVTPSFGMVEQICQCVSIPVLAMIRPRTDTFVYSARDIKIMCRDISMLRDCGVGGFLLGALTPNKEIDRAAIQAFQDAAGDIPLHFHLAWELARSPEDALETMIALGIQSARTTGGQGPSGHVQDQPENAAQFARIASGRLNLLLAGGVNKDNLPDLVQKTGIRNAHAGTSVRIPAHPTGAVNREKVAALKNAFFDGLESLDSA